MLRVFVAAFPGVVEKDSVAEIEERFVELVELILPPKISLRKYIISKKFFFSCISGHFETGQYSTPFSCFLYW